MTFFRVHGSDAGYLTATTIPGKFEGKNVHYAELRRAYCTVCQLAPPMRAHHCRVCQRCVAAFDHHCDFVATCIGERNRCRFWWFLFAQALGVGRCWSVLWSVDSTVFLMLSNWKCGSFWLLLRLFMAKLYVSVTAAAAFFLFVLHTGLAVSGCTTFECLRWQRLPYMNGIPPYRMPFSQGSLCEDMRAYGCFDFYMYGKALFWRHTVDAVDWRSRIWKPHHSLAA